MVRLREHAAHLHPRVRDHDVELLVGPDRPCLQVEPDLGQLLVEQAEQQFPRQRGIDGQPPKADPDGLVVVGEEGVVDVQRKPPNRSPMSRTATIGRPPPDRQRSFTRVTGTATGR
ncbi:hypothetical protein GCM10009827_068370 [Dactylosporangium maewongense]|uniref:Uncharacterized protein n=1 Tax=Dactylosporangium maewongense TaxID=634393 RepID=A0ABP4MD43_9ACTN